MWDLPVPGLEPVSPALAGGFLTTAPPGKPYLFIYLWLCWVFVSVRGLSPVVASGGHSSLRCAGFSPSRPLLLQSTSSRRAGSVIVAHGPSCSAACGIFPDQGSNPCPLHWQADSQPLHHQGSPLSFLLMFSLGKKRWHLLPSSLTLRYWTISFCLILNYKQKTIRIFFFFFLATHLT